MRIEPPTTEDYERLEQEIRNLNIMITMDTRREHFQSFLNAIPKLCPKCNLNNHAWNKRCYCGHNWE